MNYGQAVRHEFVRTIVHDGLDLRRPDRCNVDVFNSRATAAKDDGIGGWSVTKSSLEQINQITKILDENLRQGAIGNWQHGWLCQCGHHDLRNVRGCSEPRPIQAVGPVSTPAFTARARRPPKRNSDSRKCLPMPVC